MAKKISFVAPIVMMSLGLVSLVTGCIVKQAGSKNEVEQQGTYKSPVRTLQIGSSYTIPALTASYNSVYLSNSKNYFISHDTYLEHIDFYLFESNTSYNQLPKNRPFTVSQSKSYVIMIKNSNKQAISFKIALY